MDRPTTAPEGQEVTDREYRKIVEFLYREAQLLDARKFPEWLALMTDEVRYRVLAPTIRMLDEQEQGQPPKQVTFMDEHMGTL
jgi:3-phenylpropionate/trans-cinnamate dioxygenase subunit beta